MEKRLGNKAHITKEVEKEILETANNSVLSLDYEIASIAYKPEMNAEGIIVLPAEWDDEE